MIVTADDFGLAPEVNRAIEQAHTEGILTAASLMVSGAAAADAIARARRLPSLRVGLHLVLVDGTPTLPPERIPDLVDRDGRLRQDMARVGAAIYLRPKVRAQARAEIAAQFEAFAATGLALDHVNGHHHFHVHPSVAEDALEIGARYGVRGLRVPDEPAALLDRIEPNVRHARGWLLAPWAAQLRRRARRRGITVPRRVLGLAWSGAFTEARLAGALAALPDGLAEFYAHPAGADDFAGATPGYRYRDELAALVSPRVKQQVERAGIRLGGFRDFAPT